jgi:hypothetical protein
MGHNQSKYLPQIAIVDFFAAHQQDATHVFALGKFWSATGVRWISI